MAQEPPGAAQEERIRRRLVGEGYQQPYGTTDAEIRRNLRIRGKCADFVGFHPGRGTGLIAESKGGNIYGVEEQLENTLRGLLIIEPEAIEGIELRLYISTRQYTRLDSGVLSSYVIQDDFL